MKCRGPGRLCRRGWLVRWSREMIQDEVSEVIQEAWISRVIQGYEIGPGRGE